jgi:RNA polymerase sigma-70 factor (ECF subfamily)
MAIENMPTSYGTGRSFERVFEEHVGFVWRVLQHHGVQANDVEDATQEVFIVVSRKLSQLDGDTPIRSWLFGIARRVASAHHRKAHIRREHVTDAPPNTSEQASQHDCAERSEALVLLTSVLGDLKEEQRLAFVLREVEQLTIQEVADALGCPLQTAYSRVRAAREHVLAAFREPSALEVPDAE